MLVPMANLSFSTCYCLLKLLGISSGTTSTALTARHPLPSGHISIFLQQQNFLVMRKEKQQERFPGKAGESSSLKVFTSKLKAVEGVPRL